MLNFVQSDDVGYPHRVHVFAGSYPVTAGLAGGCLLGSMVLAIIRLRQKLNKENKSGGTSSYSDLSLGRMQASVYALSLACFQLQKPGAA